jgi:hypothetical protein
MKNEKWPSTTSASSVTAKGTAMKSEGNSQFFYGEA